MHNKSQRSGGRHQALSPPKFLFLRHAIHLVVYPLRPASIRQARFWILKGAHLRQPWTVAQPSNCKMKQKIPN